MSKTRNVPPPEPAPVARGRAVSHNSNTQFDMGLPACLGMHHERPARKPGPPDKKEKS